MLFYDHLHSFFSCTVRISVCISEGQSAFNKINSSLKKTEGKISKTVEKYNTLKDLPGKNLPREVSKADCFSMDWGSMGVDVSETFPISSEALQLVAAVDRASEEQSYLKEEMKMYISSLNERYNLINEAINEVGENESNYSVGQLARLMKEVTDIEMKAQQADYLFKEYIAINSIVGTEYTSAMNKIISEEEEYTDVMNLIVSEAIADDFADIDEALYLQNSNDQESDEE